MESAVTTSSGDTRYEHLKVAGEAYAEITALKAQVEELQRQRTNFSVENRDLKKERVSLKHALLSAERSAPLNENDERMLIRNGITLKFERKSAEGMAIKAIRNGHTLARADSRNESAVLLPQLMRRLRKELRGR